MGDFPATNTQVVDSADPDRIGDSKEELRLMLEEEELKSVTLLVLANKQDPARRTWRSKMIKTSLRLWSVIYIFMLYSVYCTHDICMHCSITTVYNIYYIYRHIERERNKLYKHTTLHMHTYQYDLYIHMWYTYMIIYIIIYICIYIYKLDIYKLDIYIYMIYDYIYIYIYIHDLWLYLHIYIYDYIFYIHIHIHTHLQTHIDIHTHTHTQTHTHTYTHIHTNTYTYTNTYTHIHTDRQAGRQTDIHT